jgi:hypothetical protein
MDALRDDLDEGNREAVAVDEDDLFILRKRRQRPAGAAQGEEVAGCDAVGFLLRKT